MYKTQNSVFVQAVSGEPSAVFRVSHTNCIETDPHAMLQAMPFSLHSRVTGDKALIGVVRTSVEHCLILVISWLVVTGRCVARRIVLQQRT